MVTYFTGPTLSQAIKAVLSQTTSHELIIVNNGNPESVSNDLDEMEKRHSNVTLLTGHGNVGFATACNKGVRAAKGEFILLLNPDTELPERALEKLISESQSLAVPWLLGAKILNEDGTEQRGSRRDELTPRNAIVEFLRLDLVFPNNPKFKRFNFNESEAPRETKVIPSISGAFMFIRRDDYLAIDGMDERYFLHVEDVDFCHRFKKSGGTIYFTPHVQMLHHQGTSESSSAKVEWSKGRGLRRYFWNNFQDEYSKALLLLLNAAIAVVYGLKVIKIKIGHALGVK